MVVVFIKVKYIGESNGFIGYKWLELVFLVLMFNIE